MNQLTSIITLFLVGISALTANSSNSNPPVYLDPSIPTDERVEDLLSRMTLHEKVVQMQNNSTINLSEFADRYSPDGVGSWHDMSLPATDAALIIDSLQAFLRAESRLKIPALITAEGVQGVIQNGCTVFPVSLAVGSTFNPDLLYRMASATAREAKAIGIRQFLSPVLDLARELRWGRVEECYGEDPYLVGIMGSNFIRGAQDNGVGAMPKHFIAYGSPTGGLNGASAAGGENDLHNIYGYPFRKVIAEAHPYAIMSSYNTYDGVPCTGSRHLMTDVLRDEMGFDGYVYSDWGAVSRLSSQHRVARNEREAALIAVNAGIDMDCADWAFSNLEDLVKSGELDEAVIDRAVRRLLRAKFDLGFFDDPSHTTTADVNAAVHTPENIRLAYDIAAESSVLLKNNGILPLDLKPGMRVALIGPNANFAPPGDYSWVGPDASGICTTLYDELKKRLPAGVELSLTEGCDWWSTDTTAICRARDAASRADVAIVAVGTRSYWLGRNAPAGIPTTGEGFDLSELTLPGSQQQLLEAVKETGCPVVVVLITGKPLVMDWADRNADALLVQFYGGEQQGAALADILAGYVNPSGKLNVSFPRSTGNTPCFYNHPLADRLVWNEETGAPAEVGGHHIADSPGSPERSGGRYVFDTPYALWPFGYGLSYTNFRLNEPKVDRTEFTSSTDTIKVSVQVDNIGDVDGKEVVQLYVRDLYSSISLPVHQLKAFSKVEVPAGESRMVELNVPLKELEFYRSPDGWILEPGEFELQIGTSSSDLPFRHRITYNDKSERK